MKDAPAIYLGQIVSKNNFRVFIYAPDGSSKLVESWDEYEKHMETGLWFANKEVAKQAVPEIEKPKRARKTSKVKTEGVLGELNIEIEKAPAVSNDDFLPTKVSQ